MIRFFKKTSPDATVYKFRIQENGKESDVAIKRIGTEFYQRKQENDMELIGHLKELMDWLYERGAEWVESRKGKDRVHRLFYGTEAAQQCLNLGGSVYAIGMKTIISYDDEYHLLQTTEGQVLSALPKGNYAPAMTEGMKKHTKTEVRRIQKEQTKKETKATLEELKELHLKNLQQQKEICITKDALKKANQQTMDKSAELEIVKKSLDNYKKIGIGVLALSLASILGSYFFNKNKNNNDGNIGQRLSA